MFYYKKHKDEALTLGTLWGFTWRLGVASMLLVWPACVGTMWVYDKIDEVCTVVKGYLAGRKARNKSKEEEDFDI